MTEIYGASIFRHPSPILLLREQKFRPGRDHRDQRLSARQLVRFTPTISAMAPGTNVYLTTYRDGQLIDVSVTLGSIQVPMSRFRAAQPRQPTWTIGIVALAGFRDRAFALQDQAYFL